MGTRITSHQLRNGLMVSGQPEQAKEKPPTIASRAVPYTGGDVKKSGELGKMFDIPTVEPTFSSSLSGHQLPKVPSRHSSSSQHNSGSVRSGPNSGPIKKFSGPMPLHPTGLLVSGSLGSGNLRRSGQLDTPGASTPAAESGGSGKMVYGSSVTSMTEDVKVGIKVSRAAVWAVLVVVSMGLLVGAFLMVAVKKAVILVAVIAVVAPLFLWVLWNCVLRRRGFVGFVKSYPEAELRGAIDGQFVKVTGVVTCGSIPLESSYERVPRCIYVSTELYEYRGCGGKSAHPKHRFFSWGCRHSEKHVADFYISDFQSGLRALVKAGYGARVAPFVKAATVVDIRKENKDLSPGFLRWLADRKLSTDDRVMRLKEGYIKEGTTVSVLGVVRRHDNVLMVVPPQEPVSTGCLWSRCLLPTFVEGLIISCDDTQNSNVIAV